MESFFFLVPIALIFVAVAIRLLFWAINSGQYDNLDTEAHRILFDEDQPSSESADQADSEDDSENDTVNAMDVPKTPQKASEPSKADKNV